MPEGAFNDTFSPVARPGDVLELSPTGEYRRVKGINALPGIGLEETFTVAANDSSKRQLSALEVNEGFLAQFRLPRLPEELPDGVYIEVDHGGRQNPAYETKNARGKLDNETGVSYGWDPNAGSSTVEGFRSEQTELFVAGTSAPYFNVVNTTAGEITFDPTFEGFAYAVEEVPRGKAEQGGRTPVVVPVEAERA